MQQITMAAHPIANAKTVNIDCKILYIVNTSLLFSRKDNAQYLP